MACSRVLASCVDPRCHIGPAKPVVSLLRCHRWQRHLGKARQRPVLAVVPVDRRSQRLEIVSRGLVADEPAAILLGRAPLHETATVGFVHIRELFASPPRQDRPRGVEQEYTRRGMRRVIFQVTDQDFLYVQFVGGPPFRWRVLVADVAGECFFCASTVVLMAARADASRSISDDPDGLVRRALSLEVKSGAFPDARHREQDSNISAMAVSVTRNLPATSATRKRPFRISVRNERTVIFPPGKNRSTASFSV